MGALIGSELKNVTPSKKHTSEDHTRAFDYASGTLDPQLAPSPFLV